MPLEPVRGEHLVPVVADPATGPAVASAADQAHRVGVRRSEERLGGGGAPVDEQPTTGAVGEAESAHVDRLGAVRADDPARGTGPARTGAAPATERSAGGSPGPSPGLAGRRHRPPVAARRVGRTGGRWTPRGCGQGREVVLVAADQGGVVLGGKGGGKVECADGRRRSSAGDSAARRGSCRKPPSALYVESGRERDSLPFSQEMAAFTSATTFFSTAGLHVLSAYDAGHMSPSSRFAESWKPSVE